MMKKITLKKITFEKAFELLGWAKRILVLVPQEGWLSGTHDLDLQVNSDGSSDPDDPNFCFLHIEVDNGEGLGWAFDFLVDDNREVLIDTEHDIMRLKRDGADVELRLLEVINLKQAIA